MKIFLKFEVSKKKYNQFERFQKSGVKTSCFVFTPGKKINNVGIKHQGVRKRTL